MPNNNNYAEELLEQIRDLLQINVAMSGQKNNVITAENNGGAGTVVTFTNAYSGNYSLSCRAYDAIGERVEFRIINKTAAGFTVIPDENCNFEYITMPLF